MKTLQKTPEEIPKIYFISNGKDGKRILNYLTALGGRNRYYNWGGRDIIAKRWNAADFSRGDYCYIDIDGDICLSTSKPENYKLKKL